MENRLISMEKKELPEGSVSDIEFDQQQVVLKILPSL